MLATPTLAEHRDPAAERLLTEQVCVTFGMLPFALGDGVLYIAIADPANTLAANVARSLSGHPVELVATDPEQITAAIAAAFTGPLSEETFTADPAPAPAPALPPRVGDYLVQRGFVTREQIKTALEEQQRTGSRLGQILVHTGVVSEQELLAVLADYYQLQRVDLTGFEPDPQIASEIPEPLARERRVVPVAFEDGVLYVAVSDVLDDATVAELREHTDAELRELLATRNSIDEMMQRIYGEDYVHTAKLALVESNPQDSAFKVITGPQKIALGLSSALVLVCLVLWTRWALIGLIGSASLFYLAVSLYRFKLTWLALGHQYEIDVTDEEIAALDERDLPVYTLLLPLYKEANIVPRLARGINALDYPKTKLDVKLLLRAGRPGDDRRDPRAEPAAAFQAGDRPRRAAQDQAEGVQLRAAAGRRRVLRDLRRRGPRPTPTSSRRRSSRSARPTRRSRASRPS